MSSARPPPICLLSVPGIRPALFAKAAEGRADTIMLDLEDSVFSEAKIEARGHVARALAETGWGDRRVLVRINGLDTEWGFRDLLGLAGCPRLDGVMVPKLDSPEALRFLEALCGQLDRERAAPLELHVLIESAIAVARVEAIAAAATRLTSMTFGAGDYAISLGSEDAFTGTLPPGDLPFAQARARVANACHAYGLIPLDGPHSRIGDDAGCQAAAEAVRAIGYAGKWAIHPAQIPIVQAVFRPGEAAVARAHRVIAALDAARAAGVGAAQLDGRLVEAGHLTMAQRIIARAENARNAP